jgi:high-affinity Fe2+/Pb2+ permease
MASEQINRSKIGATSLTVTPLLARLRAESEQERIMLTTFLVIVAAIVAGMVAHHFQAESARRVARHDANDPNVTRSARNEP